MGNRGIAPTKIKTSLSLLTLGLVRLSKGYDSLGGLLPRRERTPKG